MDGALARLATRYVGRPLLLAPLQAQELADRIRSADTRAFERPGRLGALLSKLAGGFGASGARPQAMEDDDGPREPAHRAQAYAPLYVGEVEDIGYFWTLKSGVALIECDTALGDRGEYYCGVFYHGYDTLLAAIRSAVADERVRAVFMRFSSPGGVVAGGLAALSSFMRSARAAAGGKPIWAYADMMCSAAYWIGAQSDRIWAPRVGLIGSIGAVIVHEDWSAALKEHGVAVTAIEFPEGKTDGAWFKALAPTALTALQAEIRQCATDFFAEVGQARPALTATLLEDLRAGCFMGAHEDAAMSAQAIGLVDELGHEEDAFNALVEEVKISAASPNAAPNPAATPTAAAPGGRAAAKPKDKPMADKAPKTTATARKAALDRAKLEAAAAQAKVKRLEAEDGGGEADEETDEEDAPVETPAVAEPEAEPDPDEESTDADAIAASPEASAQPEMALAAIRSGQTLAQFKANVSALKPGKNQLSSTLGNPPRLGPDGGKGPTGGASARSAGDTFAKNLDAGLKGRRQR